MIRPEKSGWRTDQTLKRSVEVHGMDDGCMHSVATIWKYLRTELVFFFVTMYHKLVSQELQNSIDIELALVSIDFCIILP